MFPCKHFFLNHNLFIKKFCTVIWYQIFHSNTNNLFQVFPYTNNILFQILIIFKRIYLTQRWDPNRFYHFEIRAMKNYSTFSRASKLEPYYQMQFYVIPRKFLFLEKEGFTPSTEDAVILL